MKKILLYSALLLLLSLTVAVAPIVDKPFPFVVVGDTGCGCDGQEQVAERMWALHKEKPYEVVLMLGDNIYGKTFRPGGDRALFEDRFDRYYQPFLEKGVKFYAVLGNHDMETRGGQDEIRDKRRFNILSDKGYYSFNSNQEVDGHPLVTFFAMNSVTIEAEEEDKVDPEQLAWLSKSLSESRATWKIPYFHHPIHSPAGAHEDSIFLLRRVEDMFMASGVQLTFAGHNHFYARMKPKKEIVHFTAGGGGRHLKDPEKTPDTDVAVSNYHFMYIEATPVLVAGPPPQTIISSPVQTAV